MVGLLDTATATMTETAIATSATTARFATSMPSIACRSNPISTVARAHGAAFHAIPRVSCRFFRRRRSIGAAESSDLTYGRDEGHTPIGGSVLDFEASHDRDRAGQAEVDRRHLAPITGRVRARIESIRTGWTRVAPRGPREKVLEERLPAVPLLRLQHPQIEAFEEPTRRADPGRDRPRTAPGIRRRVRRFRSITIGVCVGRTLLLGVSKGRLGIGVARRIPIAVNATIRIRLAFEYFIGLHRWGALGRADDRDRSGCFERVRVRVGHGYTLALR